jgi:hypothetical protein
VKYCETKINQVTVHIFYMAAMYLFRSDVHRNNKMPPDILKSRIKRISFRIEVYLEGRFIKPNSCIYFSQKKIPEKHRRIVSIEKKLSRFCAR